MCNVGVLNNHPICIHFIAVALDNCHLISANNLLQRHCCCLCRQCHCCKNCYAVIIPVTPSIALVAVLTPLRLPLPLLLRRPLLVLPLRNGRCGRVIYHCRCRRLTIAPSIAITATPSIAIAVVAVALPSCLPLPLPLHPPSPSPQHCPLPLLPSRCHHAFHCCCRHAVHYWHCCHAMAINVAPSITVVAAVLQSCLLLPLRHPLPLPLRCHCSHFHCVTVAPSVAAVSPLHHPSPLPS